MKTINQKLSITDEQYESMIWHLFNDWCLSVSLTVREHQQVLANSAINAWFLMELQKCEKEFNTLTDRYTNTNVTSVDFANCYRSCIQKLFRIRPMALLSKIAKPKAKGVIVFNALNPN
jgi:hypothetical protein